MLFITEQGASKGYCEEMQLMSIAGDLAWFHLALDSPWKAFELWPALPISLTG